jgi:hypothetical protein
LQPRVVLRNAARCGAIFLLLPCATLHAQQIYKSVDANGHVVYSDQADPSAPQTPIALAPETFTTPDTVHFCWTNCFTLVLDNGVYRRADGTAETWTIERFTPDAVVLHRHKAPTEGNSNSTDATYAGRAVDGWVRDVTVNGRPVPEIQLSWGAALDNLPGSNSERDQRHWTPSQTPVFAPNVQAPGTPETGTDGEISTNTAPPLLQEEDQSENDVDGALWTPGYWGWGGRYYWVPGTWVRPPRLGLLWTPGYWAYAGGIYTFHPGYWGPHVGYYGGINYGFGYFGTGYTGGRWEGNAFAYNRSCNKLSAAVGYKSYYEAAAKPLNAVKVSYNGGLGGTTASPTATERAATVEPHSSPTLQQRRYAQTAAGSAGPRPLYNTVHANSGAAQKPKVNPAGAAQKAGGSPTPKPPVAKARSPMPPEVVSVPATATDTDAGKAVGERKGAKAAHH